MALITVDEVQQYLPHLSIPNLDKLIVEAETLISMNTMGASTQKLSDFQLKEVKLAIVCQIDYWNEIDPNIDIIGMPQSIHVGNSTVNYEFADLSPRARRHLLVSGVLSRRVKLR